LADQPTQTVSDILKALKWKQDFVRFVWQMQRGMREPATLKRELRRMWEDVRTTSPAPGSL
jgi:hypothetical protein